MKLTIRLRWFVVVLLVVATLFVSFLPAGAGQENRAELADVRAQLTGIESYAFTADIEQTLIPRALPSMIGESSQRIDLRLDTTVNGPDSALINLRFEAGPPGAESLTLEQVGSETFLIRDGERIPVQNPAGLAAPTGNFLDYLAAANNITELDPAGLPEGYTLYAFEIDGLAFANYVARQFNTGRPAAGAPAVSPVLKGMSGAGQLWVDAEGFPQRQLLDLNIPNATTRYDAQMRIVTDYRYGDAVGAAPADLLPVSLTGEMAAPVRPAAGHTAVADGAPAGQSSPALPSFRPFTVFLTLLTLTLAFFLSGALLFNHRYRRLYTAVAWSLTVLFLFSPLVQAGGMERTRNRQAAAEAPDLMQALGYGDEAASLNETETAVRAASPAHIESAGQNPGLVCGDGGAGDTDQDTLTDETENCLGTDPYNNDSDRDLLDDATELAGFVFDGQNWYLNPLSADTNGDGLADVEEWVTPTGNAPEWDIDGDNLPNPWDDDNDNDGVYDSLDLSPYSVTASQDAFSLTLQTEADFGGFHYIDFQIRPQNPDHLRYSTDYLDWPDDSEGQIQDLDQSVEDVYLTPVIVVDTEEIPEDTLLELYGISVFFDGEQNQLFIPARPINDGGQIVAFQGKVAYDTTTAEAIEWTNMRLLWIAYMANDQKIGNQIDTSLTPLIIYQDPYQITGLEVSRHDDYDFIFLGTPGSPANDRDLFQILFGLSATYLSHQTPDLDELYTRFSNNNTDPIETWGVPAADVTAFRPDFTPGHPDRGVAEMGYRISAYLNDSGYPTNGDMVNVIAVTEQRLGATSLDTGVAVDGVELSLNSADIVITTMRHLRLNTLQYAGSGWESMAGEDALEAVLDRHDDVTADLALLQGQYPDVTADDVQQAIALFYVQWLHGQSRIIRVDGAVAADENIADQVVYDELNNPAYDLLGAYVLVVSGMLQDGGGLQIDSSAGMWSYLREDNSDVFWLPSWLSWAWGVAGYFYGTNDKGTIYFASKAIWGVLIGLYTVYWIVSSAYQFGFLGSRLGFVAQVKSAGSWALTVLAVLVYAALLILAILSADNRYEIIWAVAYYTVTIVFTIVLAIISFTVVGAIFVFLLYLIDAILFFITGKSYYEEALKAIAAYFYEFDYMTGVTTLSFLGLETELVGSSTLQEGSILKFTDTLQGEIEKLTGSASDQNLNDSYIYGQITASSTDGSVTATNQNIIETVYPDADNRTCTVDNDNETIQCWNDAGASFLFNSAGINIPIKLESKVRAKIWVRECSGALRDISAGLAECFFSTETSKFPEDLDDDSGWQPVELYIDVVPDTLDEFWSWVALTPLDADGDGLRDSEEVDTLANSWDSDGDGLGDEFETISGADYGADPNVVDSDGDGLTDRQEYRLDTAVNNKDTDGDGLTDDEEASYEDLNPLAASWSQGGWWVDTPDGSSYWMFSNPLVADLDGDGLNDWSERANGMSPYAYNDMPRLTLAVTPLATHPNGAAGAYVTLGDTIRTDLSLESFGPKAITETLQFCLPAGLTYVDGGDLSGSRTPDVQNSGSCYSWDFSGSNTLQLYESVSTAFTATVTSAAAPGHLAASLDYAVAPGGAVSQTVPVIIDTDLPAAAIMAPANNALLGGGISAYVVGGVSSDASSWVTELEVDLPGQGTVPVTGTTSPWAATWTLPADGVYTINARATDYVGNVSSDASVQVTVDNTPPTVTLDLAEGTAIPATGSRIINIPITGGASDNLSGLTRIEVSLNGRPWRTAWNEAGYPASDTFSMTWQLSGGSSAQGEHVIAVRAFDRAGNLSSELERTIVVDLMAPTADLLNRNFLNEQPPYYRPGDPIDLGGVANDGGNVPLAPVPEDLNGTLQSINDATIWLQPDSVAETANMQAAWLGDFNGDRLADAAIGLPAANGGDGKVVVVYGAGGDWPIPELSVALAEATTTFVGVAGAGLGQVLQPAGDVNGDGFDDLLIGDPANGRAFLVFGSPASMGADRLLDGPDISQWVELVIDGQSTGQDIAGAGDLNGDGFADLLITAAGGSTYLLLGAPAPAWDTVEVSLNAAAQIVSSGPTVAGVGDVNGDQLGDYALGVGGNVYLFSGQSGLVNYGLQGLTTVDAIASFASSEARPVIVPLGDANGDGLADFVFANGNAPTVVFGDGGNSFTTQSLGGFSPAANGFLAAAGDVDRDGRSDILVGNAAGDAYLLLGSDLSTAQATLTGVDAAASAPYNAGADLNSDGASDLLLVPADSAYSPFAGGRQAPFIDPETLPQAVSGRDGAASGLLAGTVYVDDDGRCEGYSPCYGDLQIAVNSATSGTAVEIFPGVYPALTVSTGPLTIYGRQPDAVFIDGGGGTFAVRVRAADVTLSNLTLRNASRGLWVDGATLSSGDAVYADHLFIYDFTAHAVYTTREAVLNLSQVTMAGSTDHIGVYGSDPIDRNWATESSSNRTILDANSAMFPSGSNLVFAGSNNTNNLFTYDPATNVWVNDTGALNGLNNSVEDGSAFAADESGDIWYVRPDLFEGIPDEPSDIIYVSDTEIYAIGLYMPLVMWDGSAWSVVGEGQAEAPTKGGFTTMTRSSTTGDIFMVDRGDGTQSWQSRVVRWDGTNWSEVVRMEDLGGCCAYFSTLLSVGDDLFIGGRFFSTLTLTATNNSLTANNVVRWNNGTLYRLGGGSGCNGTTGDVWTMDSDGSYLFIGGDFSAGKHGSCITVNADNVIRYSIGGNAFSAMGLAATNTPGVNSIGYTPPVQKVLLAGNRLYVGGQFNTARNGSITLSTQGLAIWDNPSAAIPGLNPTPWAFYRSGPGIDGTVVDMVADANSVYVGGIFDTAGWSGSAVSAGNLGIINKSTLAWTSPAGVTGSGGNGVMAIAAANPAGANSPIYLGGGLNYANGDVAPDFSLWDPATDDYTGYNIFRYDGSIWSSPTLTGSIGANPALLADGSGQLYLLDGGDESKLQVYDIVGDSWTTKDALDGAGEGAAMTLAGDELYAFKGNNSTDFCRYVDSLDVLDEHLVGYWNFDEGSGTVAYDQSGNGYDLNLINSPGYSTQKPTLPFPNSYSLDFAGTNDRASASGTPEIDSLSEITVMFWARPDVVPGGIARWITLGGTKVVLRMENGKYHFYMRIDGTLRHVRAGVPQTGTWQHVAGTYDGTTMRLYVDGVEIGSRVIAGTPAVGSGFNVNSGAEHYDGRFDELRIYNHALSPSEIQSIISLGGVDTWSCGLADAPYAIGAGAGLGWDGADYIYAIPGSNGKQLIRYNLRTDQWEILGDGSGTTTGDDDLPKAVNAGGGLAIIGNELFAVPGGGASNLYRLNNIGIYRDRLLMQDVAIIAPSTAITSTWTDMIIDDSYQVQANNIALIGGGGTAWSPSLSGYMTPTIATYAQAAFLNSALDIYRLTADSLITAGYHSYRAPAYVAPSGEEFGTIQAALASGANEIIVSAGLYQENVNLSSGVFLIGAGAGQSIIEPPNNDPAQAIIQAEGVQGATVRGFTLAGDGAQEGFRADDGAQDIVLSRSIIRDNLIGILLDGAATAVEIFNLTVVGNYDGLQAVNCAGVDVRNTIFAYNLGTALSYDGCAATQLHTYNNFWLNGTDLNPLSPGSGELFFDPQFINFAANDFRPALTSPVIDAGAPGDPSPPGSGGRVDIGYIERSAASFYADDDYCELCTNDGLTWQVDAFATIQDAVDAAETQLKLLNSQNVRFTVGVGPGTYDEAVTIPAYVDLVGADVETTIIAPSGPTDYAITFADATHAGVHNLTLQGYGGIQVIAHSRAISVTRNIINPGAYGLLASNRAWVEMRFNTFVAQTPGSGYGVAPSGNSWVRLQNNIISGFLHGLDGSGGGRIFSDYNLLYNTNDYTGANILQGESDIVGLDPLFTNGYQLQTTSPAVDAASPRAYVPTGGGDRTDIGYWELRAKPLTVFLGDDDVSSVVAYTGVSQVEYAVVSVADPTLPVTATLPGSWSTAVLADPGANVTFWSASYSTGVEAYYRIYTRATDSLGNVETDPAQWYAGAFIVDSTPPAVGAPAHFSGVTSSPFEIRADVSDFVAGYFEIDQIYFLVDGTVYPAEWVDEYWTPDSGLPREFRAWLSLPDGSYSIIAVAEDGAGNVTQSTPEPVTVTGTSTDTTAPSLTILSPLPLTTAVTKTVVFSGTAADAGSGLSSVILSFDGGISWEPASLTGGVYELIREMPDGEATTIDVQVQAVDKAGNSTVLTQTVIVDTLEPRGLAPFTFSRPPGTHFDNMGTVSIGWNTPEDGSGTPIVRIAVDTISNTIPTVDAGASTGFVAEIGTDDAYYFHISAEDSAGNKAIYHLGPWIVGSVEDSSQPFADRDQTIVIDGYIDLPLKEWDADEHLDDDERGYDASSGNLQSLYATWDGDDFYLAWQKAWWNVDGVMWAYLDTAPGGSTTPVSGGHTLPFGAEYALMVDGQNPADGLLWQYSGAWSSGPLNFAHGENGDTEVRLPLAVDLVSTLRLLAFAEDNDGLPWVVFPTTNPLTPDWLDYYEWTGLDTITVINNNQPTAPAVTLALASPQTAFSTLGPGTLVTYTIDLASQEADLVGGLAVTVTADANVTLLSLVSGATCIVCSGSEWRLTVADLPGGGSQQIVLTAQLAADLAGVNSVTTAAALGWNGQSIAADQLSLTTDGDKPTVTITPPPGTAVANGLQSFTGTASDGSGGGVALVEIRPAGGAWQPVSGTNVWSGAITVSGSGTWSLEARATDIHGLVSSVAALEFVIDGTAPVITPALPPIVNGDFTGLAGTVIDPFPVGGQVGALAVQLDDASAQWLPADLFPANPDNSQNWLFTWDLPQEDGVTHTLRISATDWVGNVGLTGWLSTVVDTVPPALTATQHITQAALANFGPALSGSVSDGYGVAQLLVNVYVPDGTAYQEVIPLVDGSWSYTPAYPPVLGIYSLWLVAQDVAGNETVVGPFNIELWGSLAAGDVTVNEDDLLALVPVSISALSAVDVTVGYMTQSGTAVAPDDYITATGTLTITAGTLTGTIPISIVDNLFYEPVEFFTVTLSSATGAFIGDGSAQVAITDNEAPPGLSVGDISVAEDGISVTVTVTLASLSVLPVSVDYGTVDGTAVAPDDYTPVTGTLTIPAFVQSGTITIPINDDFYDEPDEEFVVELTNPVNADIGDGSAQVTILDNDHTPLAVADFYTTTEETPLIVPAVGVLGNDTDDDGDSLTAVLDTGVSIGDLLFNADGSFTYTPTLDYNGPVTFLYQATDGFNASAPVTVTINVLPVNDPPTVTSLTISPAEPGEGETVQFTATVSDPDGLARLGGSPAALWRFGDGAAASGTLTPTHAYADNDVYTITLTLTDTQGAVTVYTDSLAVANVAPAVDAGPDQSVSVDNAVSFAGSFTDPGWLDSHTVVWDFGDGNGVSGVLTPSHVYTATGIYTVSLTVTDNDGGTGNDTLLVMVDEGVFTIFMPVLTQNDSTAVKDSLIVQRKPAGMAAMMPGMAERPLVEPLRRWHLLLLLVGAVFVRRKDSWG